MFKSKQVTYLCLSLFSYFAIGQSEEASHPNDPTPTYTPGEPITEARLTAGYPANASYVTGGGWDPHVTANYLYWAWDSSNMAVGYLTGTSTTTSARWQKVSPGYSSGFKVGAGFNLKHLDHWDFYSEYTWYKNSENLSLTATSSVPLRLPVGVSPISNQTVVGTFNTKVHLGFQSLDVLLERSFYAGKNLIFQIGSGLKTLWVSESNLATGSSLLVNGVNTYKNYISNFSETSWSLGPKLKFDLNWLFGYGIKALFNFSPSILYTSYNQEGVGEGIVNGVFTSVDVYRLHNYGTIRPVLESFLGLAWGQYFSNDRFHFDLSVGYDFNVYWDYDLLGASGFLTPADMYLYGLNIQARFDF